jgi:hypothetical protein
MNKFYDGFPFTRFLDLDVGGRAKWHRHTGILIFLEEKLSAQGMLVEVKKHLPFRVYGKGPVIELIREMGAFVDKKTPLEVTNAFRSDESGEIVCEVSFPGDGKVSAALTNLKLDISHPLYRKVKNYRDEVVEDLGRQELDVNRSSFKVGDLYRKSK